MTTAKRPDSQKVGAEYDRVSDAFAGLWGGNLHFGYWPAGREDMTFDEAVHHMTDEMIRRLDPGPGARILDVGCGYGAPAVRLARRRDVEVIGISVALRQVAAANDLARELGLADQVRFGYADAMLLPYPSASFDGAWALESMTHMPDKVQVLREIARVVRPGGRIAIADPVLRQPASPQEQSPIEQISSLQENAALTDIVRYPDLIEQAGLRPLEVTDVSDETRRSYLGFLEGIEADRDHYIETAGREDYEKTTAELRQAAKIPDLGYVLITAERP